MIKINQHHHHPSLFASAASLKLSKHHRHSTKFTNFAIEKENQHLIQPPSSTIIVDSSEYHKLQQILEWRLTTDFPIVKVHSYKITDNNRTNKSNLIEVLIQLQSKTKSLSEMDKLQFFQAIYVLKQSMIGFERLCDYFGLFMPSMDMIRFNENQHCKVWVSEDCFSNVANFGNVKSEKLFILELCKIVESQTIKSKISAEFFDKIKSCTYFFEAIDLIDNYSKSNKVIIPTRIQNLQVAKQSLIKASLTYKPIFNQSNSNLMKPPKIPQFIKMSKFQKTISYNPSPYGKRKMTACTAEISRDISLTNITRNNSTNSIPRNDLQDKKSKKDNQQICLEDSFLKHFNIRLIQPVGKKKKSNAISTTPNKKSSFYENRPETPFGQISETFVDEEKRSRLSFFNSYSRGDISHFSTGQRLFLTPNKPTNHDDTYSTSPKKKPLPSPRCIKTLRFLDENNEQESLDEFQKAQITQKKFQPLSISQIRQKRKFSFDLAIFPFKMMTHNQNDEQTTSPIPQQHREQKPPTSHQTIPTHQILATDESQSQKEEQSLNNTIRETIMTKNGWKGLELFVDPSNMKQSLVDVDEEQVVHRERAKTSDLLKLGTMGREVKSSMISEIEFQLEYGEQLEKQKAVRDEFLGLLG